MEIKIKNHLFLYTNKKRKHFLLDLKIFLFNKWKSDDHKNFTICKIRFFKWIFQFYNNKNTGLLKVYFPKYINS